MPRGTTSFIAIVIMLGMSWGLVQLNATRPASTLVQHLDSIPAALDGWSSQVNPPLSDDVMGKLLPTEYLSRTYSDATGRNFGFSVVYYEKQKGGESMHSPKNCLPGAGWEIWDTSTVPIQLADGREVGINRYAVRKGSSKQLVYYWYQTQERVIANEYVGKVCLVWDAMRLGHTGGSIVKINVGEGVLSEEEVQSLASTMIPAVWKCIGENPA